MHQFSTQYPIGEIGQPWGETEKSLWLAQQQVQRSYHDDVVLPLQSMLQQPELSAAAELFQYGELDYQGLALPSYPLWAVRSKHWQEGRATALITGGVHGYETSGVHGALLFIAEEFQQWSQHLNLLVLPCISPWAYETINRWNPQAIDPNRSFSPGATSAEANAVMALLSTITDPIVLHVDLHETTDSDNSEFRPAKAARDGTTNSNWNIPDGFYLVDDSEKSQPEFQRAIIQAVSSVTHIAEADETGCLIGEPIQQHGVIHYAKKALGLCGGITAAPFVTTTEVYPDSPTATATQCNQAQRATIVAAIAYVLQQNATRVVTS
jgi:hypothetical protein